MGQKAWREFLDGKLTYGRERSDWMSSYRVYLRAGFSRYQIGWVYKHERLSGAVEWFGVLLTDNHDEVRQMSPAEYKIFEKEMRINGGRFKKREEAGRALVEASADRGRLAQEKGYYLTPLGVLSEA